MKNIENYVCSLNQAKKLKELNVEQDSLYYWIYNDNDNYHVWRDAIIVDSNQPFSSFTSQELAELINKITPRFNLHIDYLDHLIQVERDCQNKNEANYRAEFLIYLLENK